MKYLIYIAFLGMIHCNAFTQEVIINKTFPSSKELNQFAFSNSDLASITKGHLIDFEDEWTSVEIDSFFYSMNLHNSSNVDGLLSMFNLLERTDIQFQFEKDSLLFPVMDHLYSNNGNEPVNVPLFIIDVDFSHLKTSKRSLMENWLSDTPYPAFGIEDIENKSIFYASLFIDTLRNNHTHLYWNSETILSNTGRNISTVQLLIGTDTITLAESQFFNISSRYPNESIQSIEILVTFSDLSMRSSQCEVLVEPSNLIASKSWPNLDDMFWNWEDEIGTSPTLTYDVKYGCGNDGKLNKPFIMVAGWGPFTDKNFINNHYCPV
jgi:hypothetical protein